MILLPFAAIVFPASARLVDLSTQGCKVFVKKECEIAGGTRVSEPRNPPGSLPSGDNRVAGRQERFPLQQKTRRVDDVQPRKPSDRLAPRIQRQISFEIAHGKNYALAQDDRDEHFLVTDEVSLFLEADLRPGRIPRKARLARPPSQMQRR